jgi:peptide deformylase
MPREPVLLPVRIIGDAILRARAKEIGSVTPPIKELAQDMVHTMYLRDGVGLAAPQIGQSIRMVVVDPYWGREDAEKAPLVMIDPVITSSSGETVNEEGCISIPGIYADVTRPSKISVQFTALDGSSHSLDLDGFAAVVVQHEMDHLEGVLFTDRISTLAKLKLKRRIKELERTAVDSVNIRTDIFVPEGR